MSWFGMLQCHVDGNKTVMGCLLLSSDHIRFSLLGRVMTLVTAKGDTVNSH